MEYHSEPTADKSTRDDTRRPLTDLCPPPHALAGEAERRHDFVRRRDGGLVHRQASSCRSARVDVASQAGRRKRSGRVGAASRSRSVAAGAGRRIYPANRRPTSCTARFAGFAALRSALFDSNRCSATAPRCRKCGPKWRPPPRAARTRSFMAGPAPAEVTLPGQSTIERPATHTSSLCPSTASWQTTTCCGERSSAVRDTGADDTATGPRCCWKISNGWPIASIACCSSAIQQNAIPARVIATCSRHTPSAAADLPIHSAPGPAEDLADGTRSAPATIDPALIDAISTITIHVPRLVRPLGGFAHPGTILPGSRNRDQRQAGRLAARRRARSAGPLQLAGRIGRTSRSRSRRPTGVSSTHEITPADLPPSFTTPPKRPRTCGDSRNESCSTSCWRRSRRKPSSGRSPNPAATRPKRPISWA